MTRPLRVLHVNNTDLDGGAARAAHRLHTALRKAGVDSHMLVLRRRDADRFVHQPQARADQVIRQRLRMAVSGQLAARQKAPTNPSQRSLNRFGSGLGDWINRSDFDIVNLHWVGEETLSIAEIGRLRKPLFWTLHDMWPFAGAEHYDDLAHPRRYTTTYDSGSRPVGYTGPDVDAATWRRKQHHWHGKAITLIGPSRWIAGCATESSLFRGNPAHVIENCIDQRRFRPIDRRTAREILGFDPAQRYLLFGATSSTNDPRKGFHLLQPALQRVAQRLGEARPELIVFGGTEPQTPPDFGMRAHYVGSVHDEVTLALLYAAADVFVAPSMQDNLPNTIVEALACGTPCVSFRIGGLPDLISHDDAGWLAQPFDTVDLADGICRHLDRALQHPRRSLLQAGQCDEATVAEGYIALYRQGAAHA